MKRIVSTVVGALMGVAALGAAGTAALAQGVQTPFFINQVNAQTPQCRTYPDAPIVGRVSGIMSGVPTRGVSFVGCFYTAEECAAWRDFVSAQIRGRLIQNRCEYR